MSFAKCCVPVAPIRLIPNHRAEMSSQLLFGEKCNVAEIDKNGWLQIICKDDGYNGWCQQGQLNLIDEKEFIAQDLYTVDWSNEIVFDGNPMIVPMGSLLSQNNLPNNIGLWQTNQMLANAETVKAFAYKLLNTAYLWGGRSAFGIDCSGFAQLIYKYLGIKLKRDAHLQAEGGEVVNFLQECKCGDLAFFDDEDGEIIHVGILLNSDKIIHASVKVRIDNIDSAGIVHSNTGKRTHQLRIIKRYF